MLARGFKFDVGGVVFSSDSHAKPGPRRPMSRLTIVGAPADRSCDRGADGDGIDDRSGRRAGALSFLLNHCFVTDERFIPCCSISTAMVAKPTISSRL